MDIHEYLFAQMVPICGYRKFKDSSCAGVQTDNEGKHIISKDSKMTLSLLSAVSSNRRGLGSLIGLIWHMANAVLLGEKMQK